MKKKSRQESGIKPSDQATGLSTGAAAGAKETSLPSFGFAADLLKKKVAPEQTSLDATLLKIEDDSPTRIFDFADGLAASAELEATPQILETWVTFSLAGETYALPVDSIREVVRVSGITRVPHAPRPIRGVSNLRGRVIPVIDLRLRLGLPETESDRSARVIAVGSRGRVIGLLVDAVHQVVHIDLNQVHPPPEDVMTIQSDYILGVYYQGDEILMMLDVDRTLILREAGVA